MDLRRAVRTDWVIGKDDVGRAVLEWRPDPREALRTEDDPCARTYDFLESLEVPALELEGANGDASGGFNPYDNCPTKARRSDLRS